MTTPLGAFLQDKLNEINTGYKNWHLNGKQKLVFTRTQTSNI